MSEVTKPEIEFNEKNHRYKVNGEFFPSVTTIIDAVVPKNLAWWGMAVGANACAELIREGLVTADTHPDEIVEAIRLNRLSVYHIRDEKGEEGTSVHKALENYAKTGEIPDLGRYSDSVRPKIRALAAFLLELRPKILESEVRVASLQYGYAGTFDLRVELPGRGTGIIDLKTGKRIYRDSQWPQLAAYEKAFVESGEAPSSFQAILHLTPDGEYDLEESTDTFEDFLVLLNHYKSMKAREQRLKNAD